MFYNRTLPNIHQVDNMMMLNCQSGTNTEYLMGKLKGFTEPTWFAEKSTNNIISLWKLKEYYTITFESTTDNTFFVHKPGKKERFDQFSKVLY